jgi:hypothetical protein
MFKMAFTSIKIRGLATLSLDCEIQKLKTVKSDIPNKPVKIQLSTIVVSTIPLGKAIIKIDNANF